MSFVGIATLLYISVMLHWLANRAHFIEALHTHVNKDMPPHEAPSASGMRNILCSLQLPQPLLRQGHGAYEWRSRSIYQVRGEGFGRVTIATDNTEHLYVLASYSSVFTSMPLLSGIAENLCRPSFDHSYATITQQHKELSTYQQNYVGLD